MGATRAKYPLCGEATALLDRYSELVTESLTLRQVLFQAVVAGNTDVHRLEQLVEDVKQHLRVNGPWRSALSEIYYAPEVTAAVATLQAALSPPAEISQLAA